MTELDKDEMRRAVARRRATGSLWRPRLLQQPPPEGGSKRWIWGVAGVGVLLLVTFISGVRVGKELSHPDDKKETASLLQDRAAQKIPFRIGEPGKGTPRETERKNNSPENGDKYKGKEGPEIKGPEKTAEEKDAKPSSKTPVSLSPKAKYALQVAALNSPEEARELVQKLKSKGYEAYMVTGSGATKGGLHRVRIGSFLSRQEAVQFAMEFEKKEKIKTIIAPLQNS